MAPLIQKWGEKPAGKMLHISNYWINYILNFKFKPLKAQTKCVCLKNVLFGNLWKFCFIKKSPIFNFYIVYDTITPNADVFLFCFVFFPTFYLWNCPKVFSICFDYLGHVHQGEWSRCVPAAADWLVICNTWQRRAGFAINQSSWFPRLLNFQHKIEIFEFATVFITLTSFEQSEFSLEFK